MVYRSQGIGVGRGKEPTTTDLGQLLHRGCIQGTEATVGELLAATEGAAVTATATGDLTLRGVTNPVEFEVTAKLENGKIGVLGAIPVVFAEYQIANPSFGGITTEDNGLLEFVLVFAQGA